RNLGWTLFFPKEMRNRPLRFACMILAGPLANLVSAYICLTLPFHKSFVSSSFILTSLGFVILNLVPYRQAQSASDGMHLLRLLFNRPRHERGLAFVQMAEELLSGVKLELISPDAVSATLEAPDESLETVLAHWIAFSVAFDERKDAEAARLLET